MWSLSYGMFWKSPVDEFVPEYGVQSAIGLFIGTWLVLGVYWHRLSADQLLLVVCNCHIGIWYDEDAEFYNTWQWRLKKRLFG